MKFSARPVLTGHKASYHSKGNNPFRTAFLGCALLILSCVRFWRFWAYRRPQGSEETVMLNSGLAFASSRRLGKVSLKCALRLPRALSALMLVLSLSLALSVALAAPSGAADEPVAISQQAIQQIAAIQAEKDSWTPAQRKIDCKLLLAAKKSRGASIVVAMPEPRSSIAPDSDNKVLVDIRADVTDKLLDRIKALGGEVVSSFAQYHAVRARVPITQIEALAAESTVQAIRPAAIPFTNKTNTSLGDVAHRADDARAGFGVDGTGVKVGVLSDSVDSLAALQTTGDLPATVTVLPGQSGNPGSSEGTALLEIVYDLAPGASLYFATGNGGEATFAGNIIALKDAGCNVIVDDIGYFVEPVFQDGTVAQAVETVSAAGVLYFSSAGNSGNKNDGTSGVWEGDFVPIAAPPVIGYGTAHNFGGANYNSITADSPSFFTLQWSDPKGGSANDYDLFLLNAARTGVYDWSNSVQNGSQDPLEGIDSQPYNDTGNTLVVIQKSGAANRYLHLNTNRGRLAVNTAGQTWGHSAASSAYSVAAVNVSTAGGGHFTGGSANPVETFSSDGPRRVFYLANGTAITPGNFSSTGGAVRQKPDIAAADGVATATPGFNPFFGTSAAAPHAAAVAALLVDYNPSLTPAQVRAALTGSALDIEVTGVDRDSGWGIVDTVAALCTIAAPVAPASASASPNPICSGSCLTLSYSGGSGCELKWYSGSCGGTYVGSGNNLSVCPTSTTTYYCRWECPPCTPSTCASVTVMVIPPPTPPTSAGVDRNNFCADDSGNIELTATGGSGTTLEWYSGSCGGTPVGTGTPLIIPSPEVTTTYFARWESPLCSPSTCVSATVTVNPLPEAPTGVPADPATICEGESTTLCVSGGSGDTCAWYTGSCGGTLVGTGTCIIVRPTSTTTYYPRWENGCGDSDCVSVTVTVNYCITITEAKAEPDDSVVLLGAKCVTLVSADFFYIEEMDRSSGIRVLSPGHPAAVGDRVTVGGAVDTIDGERVIVASGLPSIISVGNPLPDALDLRSREVGGQGYDALNPGVTDGRGALNVGLRIHFQGMVTAIDSAGSPTWYYLWDGANHSDMPVADGSGAIGVRVQAAPPVGSGAWASWIDVTGVVSASESIVPGRVIPVVLPTTASLVTTFDTVTTPPGTPLKAGWNLTGLPVAPAGTGDGDEGSTKPWDAYAILPPDRDPGSLDTRLYRWENCTGGLYVWDSWSEWGVHGPFGGLLLGDGYWLNIDEDWPVSYSGRASSLDQWVGICSPGWVILGHPKDHNTYLADVSIHDGDSICTMTEAVVTNGWIECAGYWWDSTAQGLVDIGIPACLMSNDTLIPWHGYWVEVYKGGISLIVPESPAAP